MVVPSLPPRNWFDGGGHAYAHFRPKYPAELASALASLAPARRLAIDVGCGNGQFSTVLADHFEGVLAVDPSDDQLAHAAAHGRVHYAAASASGLPAEAASADLVTAAQAAHWFDLPAFYDEVRRVSAPCAVVALIAYGVPSLPADLEARFQRFYSHELEPFWPPERRLVDRGYADLAFPFEELAPPKLELRVTWSMAEWLGYVATWSAARNARESGHRDLLERFAADVETDWGRPEERRPVAWPLHMRLGRVAG